MRFKLIWWTTTVALVMTMGLTGCWNGKKGAGNSDNRKNVSMNSFPNDMYRPTRERSFYGDNRSNMNQDDAGLMEDDDRAYSLDNGQDGTYGMYSRKSKRKKSRSNKNSAAESRNSTVQDQNRIIENVIARGSEFEGTPYHRGAKAGDTTEFDCSSFVQYLFKQEAGVKLPRTSAQQGDVIKSKSRVKTSTSQLKRGDLMFFMSHIKGGKSADYNRINKGTEKVTHVGIYLGNNEVLHTFRKGIGVTTTPLRNTHWEYRFLFGGSALNLE